LLQNNSSVVRQAKQPVPAASPSKKGGCFPATEQHGLSGERAVSGWTLFNCRLAKGASAKLSNFLALSEPAKFGGTTLC